VAAERRRERAHAREPHVEADLRDAAVGGAQEVAGALEPAREQVLVGRLAEHAPEAAAEVARRHVRGAGERLEVERLGVPAVNEVARA